MRISTAIPSFLTNTFLSTSRMAVKMSTAATGNAVLTITDRKRSAMFGLFVADATAMPVHWMYDLRQLQHDYGEIKDFVKPKDQFVGSIMNLSNTGGGGRGSDKGDIVGDVILHGKKKYWVRGGNNHYHLGLKAGENTLEAQLARVLSKSIKETGSFDAENFTKRYVNFMTTPGSHNDTYASTCHRMFFANFVKGAGSVILPTLLRLFEQSHKISTRQSNRSIPPSECADNDGHNTDAIDALTLTIPVIIKYADSDPEERNRKVKEIIYVTRKTRALDRYAVAFSDLLVSVLHGADLRTAVDTCHQNLNGNTAITGMLFGRGSSIRDTIERSRGDPMVACYIDSSFPALLHFAYKYADSPEKAILANANAGGENVARGSLVGALLGAAHGIDAFPEWTQKLHQREEIMEEINTFVASTTVAKL